MRRISSPKPSICIAPPRGLKLNTRHVRPQALMSSSEKNDESEFPPYLEVLQAESSGFETAAPSELSELRAEMKTEVVEIRNQMGAMALEMREIKTMMRRQLVPRANARSPSPSP